MHQIKSAVFHNLIGCYEWWVPLSSRTGEGRKQELQSNLSSWILDFISCLHYFMYGTLHSRSCNVPPNCSHSWMEFAHETFLFREKFVMLIGAVLDHMGKYCLYVNVGTLDILISRTAKYMMFFLSVWTFKLENDQGTESEAYFPSFTISGCNCS